MKELTQAEFEVQIRRLIRKEISKKNLAKELETDCRTLDSRIQQLSATNEELYQEYVKVLPYKQKGYDHIDFEALLIYMLKQDITIDEAAYKFGISRKTIDRRMKSMENRELVEMYKEIADNRKHRRKTRVELIQRIAELEHRTVVLGGINDRRRAELLSIESRFYELCKTMTQEEAAKVMGLKSRDRVYKLLNELYKLEIEEHTKTSEAFRERYKIDGISRVAKTDKKDVPQREEDKER